MSLGVPQSADNPLSSRELSERDAEIACIASDVRQFLKEDSMDLSLKAALTVSHPDR